jgi:hypothetical protein
MFSLREATSGSLAAVWMQARYAAGARMAWFMMLAPPILDGRLIR